MVNGVARLVEMCRNKSGLDELMVISGWNDDACTKQYIGETKRLGS